MLAAINQPHFYSSPAAVWLPGQTNWASKEWNNKKQGEKCHCHCLYTVGTRQTLIIPASFTSEKLWWWLYAASCKNDCQTTAAAVCIKRQRIKRTNFLCLSKFTSWWVQRKMPFVQNCQCTGNDWTEKKKKSSAPNKFSSLEKEKVAQFSFKPALHTGAAKKGLQSTKNKKEKGTKYTVHFICTHFSSLLLIFNSI